MTDPPLSRPPTPVLAVEHLTAAFGQARVIDDVSFEIGEGETLGLVGESGSGKSMTALSIMRLLPTGGRIAGGRLLYRGRDLLSLGEEEMRRVRGADIALIFQEPASALNPVFTIGDQIAEALTVHGRATPRDARDRAVELLRAVRVADPESRIADYPHQLSGGQRQRVTIAIAIACRPSLLIADEPTTALDVTIQAQILDLLREMRSAFKLSMLLITHDFGVVAGTADRVAVMRAGRIVETGPVRQILRAPQHPYTRELLDAIPAARAQPPASSHGAR